MNIVIGFLQESEEEVMETADFLKRNKEYIDDIFFHALVISNGSYLYEKRGDFGISFANEFNPASWSSKDGQSNPEKRLRLLELCKGHVHEKGQTFFTLSNYYIFIADDYFNKGDYEQAQHYFTKAKDLNNNIIQDELIKKKIELVNARCR